LRTDNAEKSKKNGPPEMIETKERETEEMVE
jgi:hypothetical protein